MKMPEAILKMKEVSRNIQLSKRMQMNADMLSKGQVVADIGCDHAFVSIYLIQSAAAEKVFAMDVIEGPLEIARKNVKAAGLLYDPDNCEASDGRIEIRLSDGGRALKEGEADAALIAGMGGLLMEKILTESMAVFSKMNELVLQPQSELCHFREFLCENGFVIQDERMVREEGKYYTSIKVVPYDESNHMKRQELSIAEKAYGPCLIKKKDEVLKDYLEWEKSQKSKILENLKNQKGGERIASRISQLEGEILINRQVWEML